MSPRKAAQAEVIPAVETRKLFSVTTLTGLGVPKDALVGWAAKVTAERAMDNRATLNAMREDGATRETILKYLTDARWEKSGTAAFRGTELHRAAEALNLGLELPADLDPVALPYVEQYRRFLSEHRPTFKLAEAPVYNLTLGYAGTLDSIVELPALPDVDLVLDAKTSDKPTDARSHPPYADIALQLVAYARAEVVGTSAAQMRKFNGRRYYVYDPALNYEPMPEVGGALALAVFPDRYTLTPVAIDDEVWESFLAAREVARWALEISGRVLGPPIIPTPATPEEVSS